MLFAGLTYGADNHSTLWFGSYAEQAFTIANDRGGSRVCGAMERFGKIWKDLERFGKIDDSSKKPTDDSFLNSYVDLV